MFVFRACAGSAVYRRYSIRPLKFECDCFLTQNAFSGLRNRSSFGPNSTRPALKFGAVCLRAGPDPKVRSEPSREGRASVCNREGSEGDGEAIVGGDRLRRLGRRLGPSCVPTIGQRAELREPPGALQVSSPRKCSSPCASFATASLEMPLPARK